MVHVQSDWRLRGGLARFVVVVIQLSMPMPGARRVAQVTVATLQEMNPLVKVSVVPGVLSCWLAR